MTGRDQCCEYKEGNIKGHLTDADSYHIISFPLDKEVIIHRCPQDAAWKCHLISVWGTTNLLCSCLCPNKFKKSFTGV